MKKIFIGLGVIILLTTLVLAEEGDVNVYSFRAYVDNERQNVGWSDDTIDVYPGTTLEIQIRFENNYNQTIDIEEIVGTLWDIGEDIRREKLDLEMGKDEKKTVVFEYFIPATIKDGTYDLEINYLYDAYDYNTNTTRSYKHEKTFGIDITKRIIDPLDILNNLTSQLTDERSRTNDLLSTVLSTTNLSLQLDNCRAELTGEILEGEFKSKYDEELNKSRTYEGMYSTCEGQKQGMYSLSQVDSLKMESANTAKVQQKRSDDNFLLMVIIGFLGFNFYKKKKETVGGKGEGVSLKGAKW